MRVLPSGFGLDRRARFAAILLAATVAVSAASAVFGQDSGPALGLLLDPAAVGSFPERASAENARPPVARLVADWERIERRQGYYDWSDHAVAIESLHDSGFRIALALTGTHPSHVGEAGVPTPLADGSVAAWLGFVRSAVKRFHDKVELYEIGEDPRRAGFDPETYALVLKQSALAVRAEASAHGAVARVGQAAGAAGDVEWIRSMWERDVAAYIDVIPVRVDSAGGPQGAADAIRSVREEGLRYPPAASVWAYVDGRNRWDAAAAAVSALAAGAEVAAFEPAETTHDQAQWVVGLQQLLGEGYSPAPPGQLRVDYPGAEAPPRARILGCFFRERDFSTLVVFQAPDLPGVDERLIVDAGVVRNARMYEASSGTTRRVGAMVVPDSPGFRALRITSPESRFAVPQVAVFQKQVTTPGLELDPEDVEIASSRSLTAQEIISRNQQVQRGQDDRLDRWMAHGRIGIHFKMAEGGSTVDVSVDSNYFWERGGELEWEQTGYYINGNKVTWKNIPSLPLIQPEKVITLPLDLTLNKTYRYRLTGEDRVGGREAYVLEFRPVDPDSPLSLYRGRVWIDKSEFVRLKTSLIQNNLEPPVLSNEEIDLYAPITGPEGRPYWMFDNVDGQQVWNVTGRTFVVRREVTFDAYRINPDAEEFAARRDEAYGSRNQMLRETDKGFRYLERQEDGTRTVKEEVDTNQLFAVVGAFKDNSQDTVLPLAGVNYFDYDLWGKKIQFNALFAGVFAFVTVSKPDVAGGAIDLTGDAALSALKWEDRVFFRGNPIDAETVDLRSQALALRLGVPLGQFFKVTFVGRLGINQYFDSDVSEEALGEINAAFDRSVVFELPEDHNELSGELLTAFNRRGWSFTISGRWADRSDWGPWGIRDLETGEFGSLVGGEWTDDGGNPVEDSYARWGVNVFKEWYLPNFQKVRGTINLLDGSDLDRFSRYQFSFFGEDRLNGFSGSGVRFDQGAIARVGYSFNVFEAIRFDAQLDAARVEQDDSPEGRQSFTGIGLGANLVGPWKSVVNFSYGYALNSDIDDLEGEQEFMLMIFKLF